MAFDISLSSVTYSRSALRSRLVASAASAPATTTSADFSLAAWPSPFQAQGEISPGKNAHLHRTTTASTPLRLGHESFAVYGPIALLGSAFYAVLVHRLAIYAPYFLPTLGHPHAVVLRFARCDQLAAGLAPAGVRPCWAHHKKTARPGDGGAAGVGGWQVAFQAVRWGSWITSAPWRSLSR